MSIFPAQLGENVVVFTAILIRQIEPSDRNPFGYVVFGYVAMDMAGVDKCLGF